VYARAALAAGNEEATIRRRHALHYLKLVETPDLLAADTLSGPELAVVERELGNLRAALEWACSAVEPELALRLSAALGLFWHARHGQVEGLAWLERALALEAEASPEPTSRALYAAGYLAGDQGEYPRALDFLQRSLDRWQALDHRQGMARTLVRMGYAYQNQGDFSAAEQAYRRSLEFWQSQELAGDPGLPHTLASLGRLALEAGRLAEADDLLQASSRQYQQQKNLHGMALALTHLAMARFYQGDFAGAAGQCEQSLALLDQIGLESAFALTILGLARLFAGDPVGAEAPLLDALQLRDQQQDQANLPYCLEGLAGVAAARGEPERAARLFGAAAALREASGAPMPTPVRPFYEHFLNMARAALSPAVFAAAWIAGQGIGSGIGDRGSGNDPEG
jgi:tetratricopeptide (TPR) repeat protein